MPVRVYEDVQKVVPCSSAGIGTLSRLGSQEAQERNPDGSVSEGLWHWWTSDSCPDSKQQQAFDLMNQGRSDKGLEPIAPCPMPDVPGKTCRKKFHPQRTLYPDGSFREQNWSWQPSASNRNEFGMVENWNVYFTPEEAQVYASLSNDDYLKGLDLQTTLAIYYSLLNWKCVGKTAAVLDPSPVSPQSLAGRYDTGSQFWLEFWERSLRDRIWMVREDLRQVRLPDGRSVTGLRPPADISRPPSCVSQTGQILSYVVGALTLYAGVPTWISTVMSLPDTVLGLRSMLKAAGRASEIQKALVGTPSPVEKDLMDRASNEPTQVGGRVQETGPAGVPAGPAKGLPLLLLAGIALAVLR